MLFSNTDKHMIRMSLITRWTETTITQRASWNVFDSRGSKIGSDNKVKHGAVLKWVNHKDNGLANKFPTNLLDNSNNDTSSDYMITQCNSCKAWVQGWNNYLVSWIRFSVRNHRHNLNFQDNREQKSQGWQGCKEWEIWIEWWGLWEVWWAVGGMAWVVCRSQGWNSYRKYLIWWLC